MHFIIFFIPFVLSYFTTDPITTYLTCWAGSIFLMIYSVFIDYKSNGNKLRFFSPLILSQGLLWTYVAVTSIFYFFDQLGYEFFERVGFPNEPEIEILAITQRYIVFAHACYLGGYFLYNGRKTEIQEYLIKIEPAHYVKLSIVAIIVSFIISKTPFAQLSSYLNIFSTICAVKYFGYSLSNRRLIFKGSLLFAGILMVGFLSGMKESTLFPLIYLGVILYDKYGIPRTSLVFIPLIATYLYFIPTINGVVRNASWNENKSAVETLSLLDNANIYNADRIKSTNWAFLTTRLSEVSMLNLYMTSVPKYRPYYGLAIYKDGLLSLIPRFLWPGKLSPDVTAQKRAVENGALVLNSSFDATSAKPQTLADAYMSYGYLTIFITYIIFGFLVNYFYVLSERKLGYDFGVSILFYSLFAVLSKGGPFENLFNTTFYGFVLVYVTIHILKRLNLVEINEN